MTPESRHKLRALILKHQSYKEFPDNISGDFIVGFGRNLSKRGISQNEAFILLDEDMMYFSAKLLQLFPYFEKLSENRKIALINMCFNIGVQNFMLFKNMHDALDKEDYSKAALAMLDSKWAQQAGQMAVILSQIIKTGEL